MTFYFLLKNLFSSAILYESDQNCFDYLPFTVIGLICVQHFWKIIMWKHVRIFQKWLPIYKNVYILGCSIIRI